MPSHLMEPLINIRNIKIRTTLLPGDLGYIAYMHGWLYAKEYGFGLNFEGYVLKGLYEFAHQYNPDKDRVWICEHDQVVVGFLMAICHGDNLQLRYFILLPGYRGLGLGKRLMDLFIAFMDEKRYSKAYLWTTNEQQAALSLYTRYGFELTEQKDSSAFDKSLTELRYNLVRFDHNDKMC